MPRFTKCKGLTRLPVQSFNAIEITTDRLILRPVSPFSFARQTLHWTQDTQAMSDLALKPGRWTFLKWWRKLMRISGKNRTCHGIWPKDGSPPIGMRWTRLNPETSDVSTSTFIASKEWRGKGVAAEVATALLDDLFVRCGVNKVTSWINSTNSPSIKLALSLGFTNEAVLRQSSLHLDGTRVDYLAFGMLRSEWLARRQQSAAAGLSDTRTEN